MRLPIKLLATAAAMALSLSFAQAQAPIKIGSVLSVTGGASFLGDPEKKTLEMYVADLNAKGGINGRKIEVIIYDDPSDPNQARTFATRLIE
jgi:branched-chain amino acid transport system substrate-binding protein